VGQSSFVITTSPGFEGEARSELRKLIAGAEASNLLMKGNVRLDSPLPRQETLDILREAETHCIASIAPFDVTVRVGQRVESLEPLTACLPWREWFSERKTFVIRCRRRGEHEWHSEDLKRLMGRYIEEWSEGLAILVGETELEVGVDIYQELAYVGVYEPADRILKKLAYRRKYGRGQRPLNRAELKLREALAMFEVATGPTMRALDIGAAPGGWTKVLAERVGEVISVDPGDLDADVLALPNVRHLKQRAEDVDPADVGQVDLLVNDMNIGGPESAAIMNILATHLAPEGKAIMTVKFPSRRWRHLLAEAKEALAPCYEVLVSRRLPHNGSESTLLLRRK